MLSRHVYMAGFFLNRDQSINQVPGIIFISINSPASIILDAEYNGKLSGTIPAVQIC